ncbi:MAG TPA: hypothetical protein VEG44_08880 [Candidatus Acidoferrales bacterium]|nr:hypothetical protein [Candidatus Acidoferrales bacterium]
MDETKRKNRLIESKRQLTKLLIIAAKMKYALKNEEIDLGTIVQSEIEEAKDLLKHGSLHVPKILMNSNDLAGFEKFVVAWPSISILAGVLDVVTEMEIGTILVGLPEGKILLCIKTPSIIESEFEVLPLEKSKRQASL